MRISWSLYIVSNSRINHQDLKKTIHHLNCIITEDALLFINTITFYMCFVCIGFLRVCIP